MSDSLFDGYGNRKYLVSKERAAFLDAGLRCNLELSSFCLTLALTGARISEVLALSEANIDAGNEALVFRTLKQRGKTRFRLVPIPPELLQTLVAYAKISRGLRLWNFGRTFAWYRVKAVMKEAGIAEAQCKPKALRHGFAVAAVLGGVPLNILQRWMGHARMETTAIYAGVLGEEERRLARRTWKHLERLLPK
jgi:integrase